MAQNTAGNASMESIIIVNTIFLRTLNLARCGGSQQLK
jgi:hypothetical protein